MRKGSYALGGGAEVAITAFPGDVGGVLANVNRWRGQAGLAPVDDAGLGQATSALDANGLHFTLVDAEGGANPIVAALASVERRHLVFQAHRARRTRSRRAKPAFSPSSAPFAPRSFPSSRCPPPARIRSPSWPRSA